MINVKKLLIYSIAILLVQFTEVKAENNSTGRLNPPADESGKKPKSLIPEWIEYSYHNGVLTLDSTIYIEGLRVSITNASTGFNYTIVLQNITQPINIVLNGGLYSIECEIMDNIVYYGELNVE